MNLLFAKEWCVYWKIKFLNEFLAIINNFYSKLIFSKRFKANLELFHFYFVSILSSFSFVSDSLSNKFKAAKQN